MSMTDLFHRKSLVLGILWICVIIFTGCSASGARMSGDANRQSGQQSQSGKVDRKSQAGQSGLTSQESRKDKDHQKGEMVTVGRVVDGDTFVTTERERVRLIGVDTPESTKQHEPYGKAAADFTKSRLTGRKVQLVYDVGRQDKYGRTLAYVYLADGTFFNALLVAEGYAQIMTVPPNVKHAEEFLALQRKARAQNKGLWGLKE